MGRLNPTPQRVRYINGASKFGQTLRMEKKVAPFSVVSNDDPDPGPHRPQPGHYFDQTIFDLHYRMQAARAQNMALEADLAKLGITVDPETGEVRLSAKPKA